MNLFNLIAKITLDDKHYKKGIKDATDSGKTFGQKVATGAKVAGKALAALFSAAVAVGGALAKLTLKSVSMGDTIAEESQKLNMTTKGYQLWSMLLKQNGTDINTMSMGMKTFTDILDNASKGQAEALLTLEKLGLGYEDFNGLSVEDSLKKVVEQFQTMQEGADKTQLAIDLFGRSGQELLPILNSDKGSIDKLFKSYEDLGLIMSDEAIKKSADMADQLDIVKKKFEMVGAEIGSNFIPQLERLANWLMLISDITKEEWKQAFDETWLGVIIIFWKNVGMEIKNGWHDNIRVPVAKFFIELENLTNKWKEIGKAWINGIGEGFKDGIQNLINTVVDGGKKAYQAVKDFFGIKSPSKLFKNEIGKYIPQGIAVGVKEEMPKAAKDIKNSIKENTQTADIVNGINGVIKLNNATNSGKSDMFKGGIKIMIGNREIKDFTFTAVDEKMEQRGLKTLRTLGQY